jgi:hypothetical protein
MSMSLTRIQQLSRAIESAELDCETTLQKFVATADPMLKAYLSHSYAVKTAIYYNLYERLYGK